MESAEELLALHALCNVCDAEGARVAGKEGILWRLLVEELEELLLDAYVFDDGFDDLARE